MAVQKVKVQEDEKPKSLRRYKDDLIMLVVGAEDGAMIVHPSDDGTLITIMGEVTVRELREAGIDVEDYVRRDLIAVLGEKAVRQEITQGEIFEAELPLNDEDQTEKAGLTTMRSPGMPIEAAEVESPVPVKTRRKTKVKAYAG